MTKPHAIVTAACANHGGFLVHHWLRSLRAHVDLTRIDLAVIDLGLSAPQRAALEGVRLIPGDRAGHPSVMRYAALARFLADRRDGQVLSVDGGDVIFQRDISHLFERNRERLCAVQQHHPAPLGLFLRGLSRGRRRVFRRQLRRRKTLNSGFVLGPARRLRELAETVAGLIADPGPYGTDQSIVTRQLHQWGFEALDETYNFVLGTTREDFSVEDGVFYTSRGERIAVVHNAGFRAPFRFVADFGYGPGCNTRVRRRYLALTRAGSRLLGRDAWEA